MIPYDEVGEDFVYEGGDRSLAGWRRIYWGFMVSECARMGRPPSKKAPLVMERFRVVYSQPPLRAEYPLTEEGRSLAPVLDAIVRWGLDHCFEDEPEARAAVVERITAISEPYRS